MKTFKWEIVKTVMNVKKKKKNTQTGCASFCVGKRTSALLQFKLSLRQEWPLYISIIDNREIGGVILFLLKRLGHGGKRRSMYEVSWWWRSLRCA